ncbi:MAG: nitroreductase [Xanthobacteraceae bacterium]
MTEIENEIWVVATMDVFEAVDSRISCRWFLDKPVDAAIVRDLIVRAARAASGGNLQPWQVYALAGAPLAELKRQVADYIAERDPRHVDAEYPIYPKTMWEPYRSRREEHGVQLYGALGIDRSDAAARLKQYSRNLEFFNAPVALFIAVDRNLGPGQWADLGGYIHALMFLARGHGLDSCAQESWARMHHVVRPFVKMPPEQMLFCAFAIGYGDHKHPANGFRSSRAEPQEFCRFFGFD